MSDPFSNYIFVRATHHASSLSTHAVQDVDRCVVIPVGELLFRLVGGIAPLQASDLLFGMEFPNPSHDRERFAVDRRHSKIVRAMHMKTIRALLVGATRRNANLPLSTGYELRRPVGHFERSVLSARRMHANKKFS
eukprot:scaffold348_cov329-Pavlova_lutheri.AAC.19